MKNRKQLLSAALALVLCLSLCLPALAGDTGKAVKSDHVITIDGNPVTLDAYHLIAANGGEVNYVKLRDVAELLKNTEARFNVDWRNGSIYLSTRTDYTTGNGTELQTITGTDGSYQWNNAAILVDGATKTLESIVLTDSNGGGHTLFKLRDLGEALGFIVDWTPERGIYIETTEQPQSGEPGTERLAAAKVAYSAIVETLAAENNSLTFDLIDLTASDVPELLVDMNGYYVSVYMWADVGAASVIEYWPYGAMGNTGYEYLPGQNVIRNFNSDLAGAIVYESYMTINADYEVVSLWDYSLSRWYFLDRNNNYMIDADEPILDEPIYYYGNTPITKEQYAAHQIPGDYQWMSGNKSASEMLALLTA